METKKILKLKMNCDDCPKAKTIRDYLVQLLLTLWEEGESFSGKRPFGNSGWEYDLYIPLIKSGLVDGKIDEDGYIERCDTGSANGIIFDCIESLK